MRQIRIENNALKDGKNFIACPLSYSPGNGFDCCVPYCAWFRIRKEQVGKEVEGVGYRKFVPVAYCGDKQIGEIVEEKK